MARRGKPPSPCRREKERIRHEEKQYAHTARHFAARGVYGFDRDGHGVGSSDDPLVTLSYLNETFLPQVLRAVDEKITERNTQLAGALSDQIRTDAAAFERKYGAVSGGSGEMSGTVDSFVVVTLAKDQMLCGDVGCELLLRTGSAICVANSSPGLIDETTAGTIYNGDALAKNHLYMITVTERGVRATADSTKILVRGTYAVQ